MSPLSAEQRAAYGPDWADISAAIRVRAGQRCECEGECGWTRHAPTEPLSMIDALNVDRDDQGNPVVGRCLAGNGNPSPYTGSMVVLTVAHLDRNGHDGVHDPDRLKAMCQGCHLAYDRQARR